MTICFEYVLLEIRLSGVAKLLIWEISDKTERIGTC